MNFFFCHQPGIFLPSILKFYDLWLQSFPGLITPWKSFFSPALFYLITVPFYVSFHIKKIFFDSTNPTTTLPQIVANSII